MTPQDFPKRILLVVTGMSPQVVTESLYALAVQCQPTFVPTEVRIITTSIGGREARLNLLSSQPGWFHRLLKDYQLPAIHFSSEHIHIISDQSGQPMDDIRSLEDNENAADSITELVRQLTSDDNCSLHVSIAGGRKTMGYYLGYALSLYGRQQDRLSHVLVSLPYENNRAFYYPTPYEMPIYVKQGDKEFTYDAQDAQVDLAEIPFVRLRDGLDECLKEGKTSFSQSVAEAQKALPKTSLRIDIDKRVLIAGGEAFEMKPTELALYWLLMARRKKGQTGFHYTLDNIETELLSYYGRIVGENSGLYEQMEAALKPGMTKEYINPIKNKLNKCIRDALGKRMAEEYKVFTRGKVQGTKYRYYVLVISPDAIVLPS